jgi:hypothetical protein
MVYWPYIKFLKNTLENCQMYHLLKSGKQNRGMPMSLLISLDRFPGSERTATHWNRCINVYLLKCQKWRYYSEHPGILCPNQVLTPLLRQIDLTHFV